MQNPDLLKLHIASFVPIEIHALQKQDGPSEWTFEEARKRMDEGRNNTALHEDLLFGGSHAGRAMQTLIEALAVLSFIPGGVTFAGMHFEAQSKT